MTLELSNCLRCKNQFVVGDHFMDFCKACLLGHFEDCRVTLANHLLAKHSLRASTKATSKTSEATSPGANKKSSPTS